MSQWGGQGGERRGRQRRPGTERSDAELAWLGELRSDDDVPPARPAPPPEPDRPRRRRRAQEPTQDAGPGAAALVPPAADQHGHGHRAAQGGGYWDGERAGGHHPGEPYVGEDRQGDGRYEAGYGDYYGEHGHGEHGQPGGHGFGGHDQSGYGHAHGGEYHAEGYGHGYGAGGHYEEGPYGGGARGDGAYGGSYGDAHPYDAGHGGYGDYYGEPGQPGGYGGDQDGWSGGYPAGGQHDDWSDGGTATLTRAQRRAMERRGGLDDPDDLDGLDDLDELGRRGRGRRKGKRVRNVLTTLAVLALLGLFGWIAVTGLRALVPSIGLPDLGGPEDYAGPGTGSVEIVVEPGDVAADLATQLVDADVVASREAFLAAANADPDFPSLQPGTFEVAQQLPAADAVDALLDPANRVDGGVTIPEGLRAEEILELLSEDLGIPYDLLVTAALEADLPPEAALPADLERPEPAIGDIEGWLYPDTYNFASDATADEVVATMVGQTVAELEDLGVPRDQWLEVLTKASLVQKEARLADDFPRIARVIENRLEIGTPTASGGTVPLLQLDATTNYATNTFGAFTTDEQRDSTNPYNTYAVRGLPPGPIASPSRTAVEAVLAPAEGPWLFYVAVNLCTGETRYAETEPEHQQNVGQLREWVRENRDGEGGYNCG